MKICHSFSIFSFWSLILHKMHQKHGKWIFHHWNKGEMLKITWNMVKYCRILPFFLFFPRLNFNKMHQKQERMDFLSPKEEKNAENCKKMPKNGQKTRKIPIFSLFLLLFPLLPPFPLLFPFFPLLAVLYPPFLAELLSSWLAEQEVRGSIPHLATWISEIGYLPLPSRDMAEIPIKRRKSSIKPTNQQWYWCDDSQWYQYLFDFCTLKCSLIPPFVKIKIFLASMHFADKRKVPFCHLQAKLNNRDIGNLGPRWLMEIFVTIWRRRETLVMESYMIITKVRDMYGNKILYLSPFYRR